MNDVPSDEPADAQAEFEAAVKKYHAACQEIPGLVMDWMIVIADHHVHDNGHTGTGLTMYVSEEQSLYRTAGLAKYATVRTEERMR